MAHINANGQLDTKFGDQGIVVSDINKGSYDAASAVAVDPNSGRIAVVGATGPYSNGGQTGIAIYTPDGKIFGESAGGTLDATVAVKFTDAEPGDTHTATVAPNAGNPFGGTLTQKSAEAGQFTFAYKVDNAKVQHLTEGEKATETFTVTVSDGKGGTTTQTVTVNITGTNDGPVAVDDGDAGSTNEDSSITIDPATLLANDTDVDGDSLTITAVEGTSAKGAAVTLVDGKVVYDPSAAKDLQDLGEGAKVTDTFTYTVSDGKGGTATATATVQLTGVDDKTVITGVSTKELVETDAVLETGGKLTATDPVGLNGFVASTPEGIYGQFAIATDGTWTYKTTTANNQFEAGQTYTDSVVVTTASGVEQTLTVNIAGTNDAPVIAPTGASGAVGEPSVEPTVFVAMGSIPTWVISPNIEGIAAKSGKTPYGTYSIDGNGSYTIVFSISSDAVQGTQGNFGIPVTYFEEGSRQDASVSVDFLVLEGQMVDVYVGGDPANYVYEREKPSPLPDSVTGQLEITDADGPQPSFGEQNDVQGAYGTFSIGADGQWTYTLDKTRPETVALGSKDNVTETFKVLSADGEVSTDVVVTVRGSGTSDTRQGTAGDDTLNGGTGSDVINGGAGDDRIAGGLGADYLTGGTGADTFVFNTAPGVPDVIRDFKSAEGDKLELDLGVFNQLQHDGNGHLTESIYFAGSDTPQTADQHLVFDKATGLLSYDPDGNGTDAAQAIAKLDGVTSLTPEDFKLTGGNN